MPDTPDTIAARVAALPMTMGGGLILASREEILQAITGTRPEPFSFPDNPRPRDPIVCCAFCGGFPGCEESSAHQILYFTGDQDQAETACTAYLTTYRGWRILGGALHCDTCSPEEN